MSKKSINQILDEGYVWIKEDQPWGYCPTFKNPETKKSVFELNGEFLTQEELETYLKKDWIVNQNGLDNSYKFNIIANLQWDKITETPTPKTTIEVQKYFTEIAKHTQTMENRLQEKDVPTEERLQLHEAIISNLSTISTLKWVLGAL